MSAGSTTAAGFNLHDVNIPGGMAVSVLPPAAEHIEDPIWWDQTGRDPIDRASIFHDVSGSERTAKLQKIVQDYPRYGPKMYQKCVEDDRADIIRELISLGAVIDVEAVKKPRMGLTADEDCDVPKAKMIAAIAVAAWNGRLECVKVLVNEGNLDINHRYINDLTPLNNAALFGQIEVVEWLLQQGSQITLETEDQRISDMQAAIKSGHVPTYKLLCDNEQSLAAKYRSKVRDVMEATSSGSIDMLRLIMEKVGFPPAPPWPMDEGDMDMDLPVLSDEQKENLLHCLWVNVGEQGEGSKDIMELLLSYLTPRQSDGSFQYLELDDVTEARVFNATEQAMEGSKDDVAMFELIWDTLFWPPQTLFEASIQTKKREVRARLNRRLITAASEGCPQIAKLLCEKYGANVNHLSHKYWTTPLGRAAGSGANPISGRLAVAKYLLSQPDIDIHLATGEYCNGLTALAEVVREGQRHIEIARLLLEHGGPVEEVDLELSDMVRCARDDERIPIFLAMAKNEHRFGVRLWSKVRFDEAVSMGKDMSKIELDFDKTELKRIISNLQIRKRSAVLAAADPMRRSLNNVQIKDTNEYLIHVERRYLETVEFGHEW